MKACSAAFFSAAARASGWSAAHSVSLLGPTGDGQLPMRPPQFDRVGLHKTRIGGGIAVGEEMHHLVRRAHPPSMRFGLAPLVPPVNQEIDLAQQFGHRRGRHRLQFGQGVTGVDHHRKPTRSNVPTPIGQRFGLLEWFPAEHGEPFDLGGRQNVFRTVFRLDGRPLPNTKHLGVAAPSTPQRTALHPQGKALPRAFGFGL